jgi:2,4-dienoyl-CoA reductase (NADPH2)
MRLLEPLTVGGLTAPNRVMFGPHVTNLGADDRTLTARHVAYYGRRARGGCGIIVIEGASVHGSDWPYERAPLMSRCGEGWRQIGEAVHAHGSLAIASLDHAGGQGSSAYSQLPMWAPSRVPEVNSREVPKWMEPSDIDEVIDGFVAGTAAACAAGLDGVEINAGQHSLVRQFMSGLTNHRDDEWGTDKLRFVRRIIERIRAETLDARCVLGLRLSCDELAPWAGITPEMAPDIAVALAEAGLDYLVVTRGSIYSTDKTRPDFHEPTGFNIDVCRDIRTALRDAGCEIPVILQGSIVDVGQAEWALGANDDEAVADAVEMTRAQIADPELVGKAAAGTPAHIRPCTRCNQTCQVRDARNPIVTCVGEPTSGRETEDPDWYTAAATPQDVIVVGAGPAGLETARVALLRGHRVRVIEQSPTIGGVASIAGPHADLVDWYHRELDRLGAVIDTDTEWEDAGEQAVVVQCTGGRPGRRDYDTADDAVPVLDVVDVLRGTELPDGQIALFDPIGGPIAVSLAEELADRAVLITQDNIAGNELSRSGDLAPANSRLAQRGVQIERRAILRAVVAAGAVVEDRFSGERRTIPCTAVVDCGFRLPSEPLEGAAHVAGDAVAPRTVLEAVLEGRRVARAI